MVKPIEEKDKIYLITGGCGFIGSFTAKHLHAEGIYVRIADIAPFPDQQPICSEYLQGNLCDPAFCDLVIQGVHTVLHFAANMGGMGIIHEENDFTIFRENNAMTTNILQSSVQAGVARFLYASSACVYPEHLQASNKSGDVQLCEGDVWSGEPAPQGLYGLEKLVGELLIRQHAPKISVRIARFHNVFGPGGCWYGGREKAPAALARKAVVAKKVGTKMGPFELWGDGSQRRSFLYIEDCVDGIVRLLNSDHTEPVNIGSDRSISIRSLAMMAIDAAGLDPSQVSFSYNANKPTGVQSRNSNNELVRKVLNWTPRTSLEGGMKQTVAWIATQLEELLPLMNRQRIAFLKELQESKIIRLRSNMITFGVLLPLTSRGTDLPTKCLHNLRNLAASLSSTTWRDTHSLGGTKFCVKIYLAIDHDDEFLLQGSKAEAILQSEGVRDITTLTCRYPRGQICSLWRACAARAWNDGCHYLALFGDDVVLLDEGWLRGIHNAFQKLSEQNCAPHGFGCIAFTDISFPGMPTFPIIHRTHMDIFGEVVPPDFIKQDGDPFLFQLYRRFGSSVMVSYRVRNTIGGSDDARYRKQHLAGWTFETIDGATSTIEQWLDIHGHPVGRKLTLDVIIPSFRVQLDKLGPILELKSSNSCEVMFIIIIDDPQSKEIAELQHKYSSRVDVRIRMNARNLGASASRNRGMGESAAEWIHFLDDDVVPNSNILINAEQVIRANPNAAGFVGNTQFPPANSIFTTAVHLAGVTYFWDIATKIADDVPWGVTANLIARRNKDGLRYDLRFPKTGGGEDIDYCVRKRNLFVAEGKSGFKAAPDVVATHPWWHDGQRTYWRFYMWSKGDGALVAMFPELCYTDYSPTSAQLFLYNASLTLLGLFTTKWSLTVAGLVGVVAAFIANVAHDFFRHVVLDRTVEPRSTIGSVSWVVAIAESSIIRMISETGRLVGQFERREWLLVILNRRFDWFVGRMGTGPMDNDRRNTRERLFLWILLFSVL